MAKVIQTGPDEREYPAFIVLKSAEVLPRPRSPRLLVLSAGRSGRYATVELTNSQVNELIDGLLKWLNPDD